jgi:hypothetical protein
VELTGWGACGLEQVQRGDRLWCGDGFGVVTGLDVVTGFDMVTGFDIVTGFDAGLADGEGVGEEAAGA